MKIALIADPHVSLLDRTHCGMRLAENAIITEAVIADVARRRPDLVIWMGDLTHEGTDAVRERFVDLHGGLAVPALQFLGNHDVEHIDKAGFARDTLPCVRRQWWHVAGWDVVVLDTVRELSPSDPSAVLTPAEARFLHDVASEATGPLLVMGHHPIRPQYLDTSVFWEAVAPHRGTGVYLGGHTHNDRYEVEGDWHLFDVASCCHRPFGYRWLQLSPGRMSLEPITVPVPGVAEGDDAVPEPVYPVSVDARSAGEPAGGEPAAGQLSEAQPSGGGA